MGIFVLGYSIAVPVMSGPRTMQAEPLSIEGTAVLKVNQYGPESLTDPVISKSHVYSDKDYGDALQSSFSNTTLNFRKCERRAAVSAAKILAMTQKRS